jgi:hypothetical protein
MDTNTNRARLAALTKDLLLRWEETRAHWQDAKAAEFEREYIEELITSVDAAVAAADKLGPMLRQIRSDCE